MSFPHLIVLSSPHSSLNLRIVDILILPASHLETPSQHRTRLGPTPPQQLRVNTSNYRAANGLGRGSTPQSIAPARQTFGHPDINNVSGVGRASLNGYGMSAGMKVGRQPGTLFEQGLT